ncbi:AAA family ATPase [Halocatena halophila]|uniref:AAA family ATPase n=1 Tax=Halocatena halophila TaxID=2814576 RepID=UPI002ED62CA5
MKIASVTFNNYKPYHSEVAVDLKTDDDKPLVLIEGQNDRGKSAFYSGLKFCLYGFEGTRTEVNEQQRQAINRKAAEDGLDETSVAVEFLHEDDVYEIKRVITFDQVDDPDERSPNNSYVTVEKNGNQEVGKSDLPHEYNEVINPILPEKASKFFFFDAEDDLQKYMKHTEEVKQAIETVLGIEEIQNAIEDLRERQKQYNKKFLTAQSNVDEYSQIKQDLEEILFRKEHLESEKKRLKNDRDQAEKRLSGIEEDLGNIKEIAEKQSKLDDTENEINNKESELDTKIDRRQDLLRLAGPLITAVGTSHVEQCYDFDSIDGGEEVIKHILESGTCICGDSLDKDDKESLRDQLEELASDGRKRTIKARDKASKLELGSEQKKEEFTLVQRRIYELERDLRTLRSTRDDLEQEIDEATEDDHKQLKKQKEQTNEQIEELKSEIEDINQKIGKVEGEEEQKERRIDSLGGASEDEKYFRKLRDLTARSKEAMQDLKEEFVESRQTAVENHTSKTFRELTNKSDVYDGINITSEYKLQVKTDTATRDVQEQAPSAGATQIIAYSFIAGLNNYTARKAPVVIDTPLSRLDKEHKDNLIKYYPEFSEQVIILYHPRELEKEDIEYLSEYASKHLEIEQKEDEPEAALISPGQRQTTLM